VKEIYSFYYNLTNFLHLKIRHHLVFESYDAAWGVTFSRLDTDVDTEGLRRELHAMGLQQHEISFLFDILIQHGNRKLNGRKEKLYGVIRPCNRVAGAITIIGGVLYASVRLMLLSLAFCALRYVPECVYTASWTRYLPNIS
jgi:hypothetical protein